MHFARVRRVFRLRKGSVWVEEMICADQLLNALDEQLAQQYQSMLGNLTANTAVIVRTAQRNWLTERNACGMQAANERDCLMGSMSRRLKALLAGDSLNP